MAVKHPTLIVQTMPMRGLGEASMVYGLTQAAVAKAVAKSVVDGILLASEELVLIANVFVHPTATRHRRVYINNYKAMRHAIQKAMEGRPKMHSRSHILWVRLFKIDRLCNQQSDM
jgi:formaldehyde-activating enzyme